MDFDAARRYLGGYFLPGFLIALFGAGHLPFGRLPGSHIFVIGVGDLPRINQMQSLGPVEVQDSAGKIPHIDTDFHHHTAGRQQR